MKKTRMHNVLPGSQPLSSSRLARIASWLTSGLARVSSWKLESLPGWLESLPGWLESLPGKLKSLPGWLEFLPGWLESLISHILPLSLISHWL